MKELTPTQSKMLKEALKGLNEESDNPFVDPVYIKEKCNTIIRIVDGR